MGFEEWNVLKEYLDARCSLRFTVEHTLAILPTETNYSRTTIFSGLTPKRIIEKKIADKVETRHEEKLFKRALDGCGISENDVFYQRMKGPDDIGADMDSLHDFNWLGIVFTFMDTLAHNKLTTKSKLIRDIRHFLDKSDMDRFIEKLLDQDFQVFFVSDHGNIYAKGAGIRAKKDLVNEKARRYMIFKYKELAGEYETQNTVLLQLRNIIGDQWLLLQSGNEMFGNPNHECVTHGGISIEEVVVPFVKVMRK